MLNELGLSVDEFLVFQEFHFSLKLFTVNVEKRFPIFRKFTRLLDFIITIFKYLIFVPLF